MLREQMVVAAKVGDALRIVNDDNVAHRLHADALAVCRIQHLTWPPEQHRITRCRLRILIRSELEPLYDHDYGTAAAFWIKVTAA